jgi:hypothetical protein
MSESVRITLSRCGEHFALIDREFEELVRGYRWTLHHCGKGKLYARAERCPVTKQKIRLYMHRLIAPLVIGEAPGAGYVVDHRDGDGLNNCGANFRWLKAYDNRWKYARHRRENPAHA